ncbi:MAG: hypothetical protein IIB64_04650 [Proteobacteria bacterium]|nr:hypothetical protein [Pseudomonadota bacterium]
MDIILARKIFGWFLLVFSLIRISPYMGKIYPVFNENTSNLTGIILLILLFWLTFLMFRNVWGKDYETFLDLIIELFIFMLKTFFPNKLNPKETWARVLIFFTLLLIIVPSSLIYLTTGALLTPWEIIFYFNLPLFWGLAILMKVLV